MINIPVCAIVVSYNPDQSLLENIIALSSQVSEVLVIDNNSAIGCMETLLAIEKMASCKVVYNNDNMGIAAALNIGIRHAAANGYDWVATFDQDSLVPADFINNLFDTLADCPFQKDVAIVAPRYRDRVTGVLASYGGQCNAEGSVEVDSIITSGNLVRISAVKAVGGFDDELFIDAVDHDFCLRLRKGGFRILISCNTELFHSIGAMELHQLFGRQYKVSNHSQLRRYYNARNRLTIYKRYLSTFPEWVRRDFLNWLREIAGIVLFEKNAVSKLAAMGKGVFHGLLGRLGKIKE